MAKRNNIINKGVHCKVNVHGSGLIVGTSYTACLYCSAKQNDYRATQTVTAILVDEQPTCIFDFQPEQTALLRTGNVIFEVWDTESLQKMVYDDAFAIIRPTSLKA